MLPISGFCANAALKNNVFLHVYPTVILQFAGLVSLPSRFYPGVILLLSLAASYMLLGIYRERERETDVGVDPKPVGAT